VNVGDIMAGKYEVERVLGIGGMGVVVAARHLTLGEHVAIKFLLPEALHRSEVVARFLREGQAAARLRSEHVARVYDVGKLESGSPFLVMEYLDGQDLGRILKQHQVLPPIATAIDYVLQACEGLAEAHASGIVHRDLKPGNLFLVIRPDGSTCIKLIDFGISKVQLPNTDGEDGGMTSTADVMGSPLYMAPEQMRRARDVDVRADIWSLGVILHALVTGKLPFRAPSLIELYSLIGEGAPPVRTMRPEAPEALEATILRCLQKERDNRFPNVAELAAALAHHGGPDAQASAARTRRTLETVASRRTASRPSGANVVVDIVSVTPASGSGKSSSLAGSLPKSTIDGIEGPTAPDRLAPSTVPPVTPISEPHATTGSWGQNTRAPLGRARPLMMALGATGVLVALGSAVAVFGNAGSSPAAGESTGSVVTIGDAPKPPAVLVADPAPPPRQPASSPEPVASVTPAEPLPPSTSAPPPGRAASPSQKGVPRPSPHAPTSPSRSADDLFGTQK
jgi:serine/threonine-protein kinase